MIKISHCQIQLFILPSLGTSDLFSVGVLIKYLEGPVPGSLKVPSSPQLLNSLLALSRGRLGAMEPQQEAAFLNVISILTRLETLT